MSNELVPRRGGGLVPLRVARALARAETQDTLDVVRTQLVVRAKQRRVDAVVDVTDDAMDGMTHLVKSARRRAADGDPAKVIGCADLLDSAKGELERIVRETGREL